MGKKKDTDGKPPFHLVNRRTGKHLGPFSTRIDALLATQLASWGDSWTAMDKTEFDAHLEETRGQDQE